MQTKKTFSILITTKNRKDDLAFTLQKSLHLLERPDVECLVYDDGSTDGTCEFIKEQHPQIKLFRNETSKGLIFCRNQLLDLTTADYAVSLDDDANFLSENPFEAIARHFLAHPNCAVLGLRIFWGLQVPDSTQTLENVQNVQGFVGCGHVWRLAAWRKIPNYPDWFVFYGEEEFAAMQLFKKKLEIHYLPEVLVHHRVEVKKRKSAPDYAWRLRRSLRAGWYLFFLFIPLRQIPKKMAYSIWAQIKLKVFKGDFKALLAICRALLDLIFALPKIVSHSNRFTQEEYDSFQKLYPTPIYWKPGE